MKELQIIGNIWKDASLNIVNTNTFLNFSVAVNDSYKKADGTKVEKTTWVECWKAIPNGQSTKVVDYLKKGTQVMVRGDVEINLYTTREGKPAASFKLRIDKLQLLGSKSEGSQVQQQASQPDYSQNGTPAPIGNDSEPDDLPF